MPHSSDNTDDGPRERLRAWKPGDADLPQHTLDRLADLEKAGKLRPSDVALLRGHEGSVRKPGPSGHPKPPVPPVPPPPPEAPPELPPDQGDSRGLASLLDRVEGWVKTVPASGTVRATPATLGNLMQPQGHLKAGDVVVLAPGTYAEKYVLSQEVDGTPADPLVFVGAEGVRITGVVVVDNPNTVAHSLLPSAGGRVQAGGFVVSVPAPV